MMIRQFIKHTNYYYDENGKVKRLFSLEACTDIQNSCRNALYINRHAIREKYKKNPVDLSNTIVAKTNEGLR